MGDLFCCAYASFFWQAIQVGYLEYTTYNHELGKLEIILAIIMVNVINDEETKTEYSILRYEEGVDFILGNIELSSLETLLVNIMSREMVMHTYIEQ